MNPRNRNNNNNFRKKTFGKPKFHGRRNGSSNSYSRDNENSGTIDIRNVRKAEQSQEKYLQMAKDALSGGDRVLAENYYQHADHYARIIIEAEKSGINLRNIENKNALDANTQPLNPVATTTASPAAIIQPLGGNAENFNQEVPLQNVSFLKKAEPVQNQNIEIIEEKF